MRLLHRLLEVADAKDKAVRFRATDLIACMMNELDEETEIEYVHRTPSAFGKGPCALNPAVRDCQRGVVGAAVRTNAEARSGQVPYHTCGRCTRTGSSSAC